MHPSGGERAARSSWRVECGRGVWQQPPKINDERPKGYRTRLIGLLSFFLIFPCTYAHTIMGDKKSNDIGVFAKIKQYITRDLWRMSDDDFLSFWKRLGFRAAKTIVLVVRGFSSKQLNKTANSLTFSLMFAIVPILAMMFAIADGFGFGDVIKEQLGKSFLGNTNMVDPIMGMVDRYMETAQGGVFLGIGILILIWAVYSFFQSVETEFNLIWNVQQNRSVTYRIVTYIAILFFAPILIIVSSGLSIAFHATVEAFPSLEHLHHFHSNGVRAIQYFTTILLFMLLYKGVPNTKVGWWAALIPGVLFGVLFQGLQELSVYLLVFLGRTSIVYGTFALIPILLTFLQWTCLLILIGAEMSYAIQNNEQFEYEQDVATMSRRYKDCITLFLLNTIVRRYDAQQSPMTSIELAKQTGVPIRLTNRLLQRLEEVGLVARYFQEGKEDLPYIPAIPSASISVGEVLKRIDSQGSELFLSHASVELMQFWERYHKAKERYYDENDIKINEI